VDRAVRSIHELAAAGETGALTVVGHPGGLVFFVDGRIGGAESPVTPGAEATLLRTRADALAARRAVRSGAVPALASGRSQPAAPANGHAAGQPGGGIATHPGPVTGGPIAPGPLEARAVDAGATDGGALPWVEQVASMRTPAGRKAAAARAEALVREGEVSPFRLAVAVQVATADALLAMLAGEGTTVSRTRFLGGHRPWARLPEPLTARAALAETARRGRLLTSLAAYVRPDDPLSRRRNPTTHRLRLTAVQWDLVRLADGRRTARDLAWLLGRGVLATTVDVHQLVAAGLLAAGGRGAEGDDAGPHVVGRHTLSFLRVAVPDAGTGPVGPTMSTGGVREATP
jgi:hypothetical protein